MRGAELVNDEFEVGYNQDFEASFYRAALVGRTLMLLFVIGAIAGLYGRGPFSHATLNAAGGTLTVDYEPVARFGTPTLVTLHVRNPSTDPLPLTVTLGNHFVQPLGFQHSFPQPDSSVITHAGMALHYTVAAQQGDSMIRLVLSPSAIGRVGSHIQLSTGAAASWSQLIMP
jgi:hypothetical protein